MGMMGVGAPQSRLPDLQPRSVMPLAGIQAQRTQPFRQLRVGLQVPQGCQGRGAVGRRNGRREDEGPGSVAHIVRHLLRAAM